MSFLSKVIEVVNITNGSDVVVEMSYNLTLEGTPKPQARPRLGRNGFFHTPGKKDMAALKAKIKKVEQTTFLSLAPINLLLSTSNSS